MQKYRAIGQVGNYKSVITVKSDIGIKICSCVFNRWYLSTKNSRNIITYNLSSLDILQASAGN